MVASDPDLSWAMYKALLIVAATFFSVGSLAWLAAMKKFFK
jgi:hypothetical protein